MFEGSKPAQDYVTFCSNFYNISGDSYTLAILAGYRGRQGCQMVCFQTKNPNLGKFWKVLLR
jgi:hypothetical protein